MTLTLDANLTSQLQEIRHRAMMARPDMTLERAIGHLGKEPSYATGDAIKILGKMIVVVRWDKKKAA